MKKSIIILLVLICSLCSFGQTAGIKGWNSQTCEYTNNKDYFHWNLDPNLQWELRQGNEVHTSFMAVSPYGLMVFVQISPLNGDLPLWENFAGYHKIMINSLKALDNRMGCKTSLLKFERKKFAGTESFLEISKVVFEDEIISEVSYGISFRFHKDGKNWYVSLKCAEDIWNEFGYEGLKPIFSTFGLNYNPNAYSSTNKK